MNPARSCDVAIVGAGLAGLCAAEELARAGASVHVFEAHERAGGRVATSTLCGKPVELGAQYVHGEARALRERLARYNLKTQAVEHSGTRLYHNHAGTVVEVRPPAALMEEWTEIPTDEHDLALDRWLATHPPPSAGPDERALLGRFLEVYHAAPASELTVGFALIDDEVTGASVLADASLDRLVASMVQGAEAAGACIHLNSPVSALAHGRVDVGKERWACAHTLVTASVATLPRLLAGTEPPTALKKYLDTVGRGAVAKIIVAPDQAFWDPNVTHLYFANGPVVTAIVDQEHARLSLWLHPQALTASRDELLAAAAKQLSAFGYRGDASGLGSVAWQRWEEDPYVGMAYSSLGPAALPHSPGKPVTWGQMTVAGEAFVESTKMATMHGALDSGRLAAEALKNVVQAR